MFKKFLASAAVALAVAFTGISDAKAATVDTVLSLVIDVSGSVDATEYNLQMQGYINAFNDAAVQAAITDTTGGKTGSIAVNLIQFGSSAHQMLGFFVIDSAAAAVNFATQIAGVVRAESGLTNIASGVNLANSTISSWLSTNSAARAVIDVSGDGTHNTGATSQLTSARDAACGGNVDVINGIAIQSSTLEAYYDANLVCGTGAFSLFASSFDTFDNAIKRKLLAEIKNENPNPVPLPMPALLLLSGLGGLGLLRRRQTA